MTSSYLETRRNLSESMVAAERLMSALRHERNGWEQVNVMSYLADQFHGMATGKPYIPINEDAYQVIQDMSWHFQDACDVAETARADAA